MSTEGGLNTDTSRRRTDEAIRNVACPRFCPDAHVNRDQTSLEKADYTQFVFELKYVLRSIA